MSLQLPDDSERLLEIRRILSGEQEHSFGRQLGAMHRFFEGRASFNQSEFEEVIFLLIQDAVDSARRQ